MEILLTPSTLVVPWTKVSIREECSGTVRAEFTSQMG